MTEAIRALHEWWRESRREPADIVIGRLVDRLGLMPFVASSTLGTLRAGIMAYALDSVRAEALRGNASLAGAVEALEAALKWEDAEAPFDPGQGDAVRVMNLHKAKGLQGTVVVLANPRQTVSHTRKLDAHTRRGARGAAEAFAAVTTPAGPFSSWTLAQPLEWSELAQRRRCGSWRPRNSASCTWPAPVRGRSWSSHARMENPVGESSTGGWTATPKSCSWRRTCRSRGSAWLEAPRICWRKRRRPRPA